LQTPSNHEGSLRFDVYELNLRAGELIKGGRKIRLQEQPFRILAILLEKPGQVVTREELREQLWPADTFVDFDHSLNTAVKKLRQALNDEAEKPRFVETLPKRGYRYIGPEVEMISGEHPLPETAAEPASAAPALLTKSPARRWWIVATVAALVAAAGVTGYLYYLYRAPLLTEKDSIVLADFENSTGDSVFDDALKQGLAVQLGQSPYLSILSDEKVRETLKLMGRAPGDRITPDLARDLCQRASSKAYLSGTIARLGNQYVIGVSAVNCRTGDVIAQEQAEADQKESVLKVLGQESKELRKKLGESFGSIQKYDTPIEQATTPSLEALKAYSLGAKTSHETGEVAAIPSFKRAIELDPEFALAYVRLGGTYVALGEPSLAAENLQRAYDLRKDVTENEQFEIAAYYYNGVTGELEKAIQICETWARAYPRDWHPHQVLGYNYELMGRYEKAVSENMEAIRLDPDVGLLYSNLMEVYTSLNRLAEAKATYRRALDRKLDGTWLHTDMYMIAILEGDAAEMQRQIALSADMPGAEDWALTTQSDTAAYFGHLAKAREFSDRAVESARRNDLKEVAAIWKLNGAMREAEFGNVEQARLAVEEGLKLATTRDSEILAAAVFARTGDASRAEALADKLHKQFPDSTELNSYWLPSVRAAILLLRNNPAAALKILEPAATYELGYPRPQLEGGSLLYPAYLRGQAYLLLHQGKEAALEFQKFQDQRAVVVNCHLGALARVWLGRAYASRGDIGKARAAYQDFFTLWKDADPGIPIFREAKTEYSKLVAQ
jgi:DNA-binding winged helix-turn-helix (wHTH) protein/tetratricopeptide (TPR) repeat protein